MMRRTFYAFLTTFLSFLLTGAPALAQSTRILDGSYVTKQSNFRNFVINPDAQTNVASVTLTTATATRSTTTPVSENGSTEFNIAITSANGKVDFLASGATQAVLGGQQCEVGFRGRGFQSTSTLQAFDGTNVLATYVFGALTNTTNVALPFPCPTDPSTIRVRITDTATLAGTNEVAGVYFGRSRGIYDAGNITAWTSYPCTTTSVSAGNIAGTTTCQYRRIGDSAQVQIYFVKSAAAGSGANDIEWPIPSGLAYDSTKLPGTSEQVIGSVSYYTGSSYSNQLVPVIISNTIRVQKTTGATRYTPGDIAANSQFSINAFVPISQWTTTSAAITPNQQNVWGTAQISTGAAGTGVTLTSATYVTFNSSAFSTQTVAGAATIPTTGTCGTTNDLATCYPYLPAGSYRVTYNGDLSATFSSGVNQCLFALYDGTTRKGSAQTIAAVASQEDHVSSLEGVFTYTTAQTNVSFRVQGLRAAAAGTCNATVDSTASLQRTPQFTVQRIDTANTQPVYIQGPVKAAADGVAIKAGDVGENKKASVLRSAPVSISSGVETPITSFITLTPGTWVVSGATVFETAAASTITAGTTQFSITNTGGAPASDTVGVPTNGLLQYRIASSQAASSVSAYAFHPYQVTVASGATLSLRIAVSATITGTVNVYGSLEATRIN